MAPKQKQFPSNPKLAVAYIRASKRQQALSPEAQRSAIELFAKREGLQIVSWHVDAISGGAPLEKRINLTAALDSLTSSRAGALIVAKRDRLARDVMNAAMIERIAERVGARVISAQGEGNGNSPEALLLRGIMDVFAQYERALIRYRTAAALAVKKAKGERVGRIPFGYRLASDGRTLEADPDELGILARMKLLRSAGASLRAIADVLKHEGVTGGGGAPFSHVSVADLLQRAEERAS